MRLFKHGNSFAIVVPDNLCKKLGLSENSDLEFFEVEQGVMVLATRQFLESRVKTAVQSVLKISDLQVFSTEAAAREASKKVELQLRKGEVIATFGSDKKYYLITNELYARVAAKTSPLLDVEKTFAQLVTESGLPMQQLVPVVAIMKERGELIEKRKGYFLLVK